LPKAAALRYLGRHMTLSRRARSLLLGALVLALSLVFSAVWTTLLGMRSQKVILSSCDPSFCLRVVEGITSYGVFSTEQLYEVWITRAHSPDYGYVVHHSFGWQGFDSEATIRDCKVEWSPAGVTLLEPSGQRLFVPEELYRGGR
jgi:hypothetical protein